MPATLPAHAAAVLPLLKRVDGWARTALVVGACAPDFSYVWVPRAWGRVAHTPPGLFVYCLPAGLLVLVWWEVLVVRVLQHVSTLVGSLVVLGYLARGYPRLEPVPGGAGRAAWSVLGPALVGAVGGLGGRVWRYESMGALEAQVWWVFWPTVTGALVGLTLGCALARWRAGRGGARGPGHEAP